jgi:membrane fusion protein, heavy metal efflux system
LRRTVSRLAFVVTLGGCGVEAPPEARPSEPAVLRSSPTAWEAVTLPMDLALVETSARVVGEPGSRTVIAPVFEGQVLAVHVQPGDRVEKGARIADLSTPEVTRAAATLRTTKEQLVMQRRRLQELERLRDQGLVGTREVFAVRERVATLETERANAAATLSAAGVARTARFDGDVLRLHATSTGTVTEVDAAPGQIRGPNEGPLAVIVAQGPARIEANVSGMLPPASSIVFATRDGREIPLRPEPLATAIDPLDGMTRVWLVPLDEEVTLTHGLRGVLRMRPEVDAGAEQPLLQVPANALRLEPDGRAVVLVRDEERTIREVVVRVEAQSGSAALVRSPGLRVGDEVAADSATVLREPPAGDD